MALILEFRKKLLPDSKPHPAIAMGTGKVVLFTGVRYERMTSLDTVPSGKPVLRTKSPIQKRGKSIQSIFEFDGTSSG